MYLNLDNVYIELQKNKIINRYRIIHNFQFKIEILLNLYQIKFRLVVHTLLITAEKGLGHENMTLCSV